MEQKLYWLLKIAKKKSNLNTLLRAGLSFKMIAELTDLAEENELLTRLEGSYFLTQKGEEKFEELSLLNKKTNKEEWIAKETDSQIPKLDPNFIYLPDPNELTF